MGHNGLARDRERDKRGTGRRKSIETSRVCCPTLSGHMGHQVGRTVPLDIFMWDTFILVEKITLHAHGGTMTLQCFPAWQGVSC
jgi:hypothetical protein